MPLKSPRKPSRPTVSLKQCVIDRKWCVCMRALMLSKGKPTMVELTPAAAEAIRVARIEWWRITGGRDSDEASSPDRADFMALASFFLLSFFFLSSFFLLSFFCFFLGCEVIEGNYFEEREERKEEREEREERKERKKRKGRKKGEFFSFFFSFLCFSCLFFSFLFFFSC